MFFHVPYALVYIWYRNIERHACDFTELFSFVEFVTQKQKNSCIVREAHM